MGYTKRLRAEQVGISTGTGAYEKKERGRLRRFSLHINFEMMFIE